MAQGSNEHRMVFDIRGRRGYVIKVVYAILALLMVASLFLVTGAVNLNSILGTGSSGESATSSFEKQAANLEAKLAKEPESETLLANLTRARINTANVMINSGETGTGVEEEVKHQLALASEDWSRYLAAAKEPSPILTSQASTALFQLAGVASSNAEALESVKAATEAQKLVTETQPSVHSWSTLAVLQLYNQEFKAAGEAKEETTKLMSTKFERESFENQFEETEKQAKEFGKDIKLEKASKSQSSKAGKESLENPIPGLGGTGLGG
jgi:hypothetical protein